jgi:hypothetical protein
MNPAGGRLRGHLVRSTYLFRWTTMCWLAITTWVGIFLAVATAQPAWVFVVPTLVAAGIQVRDVVELRRMRALHGRLCRREEGPRWKRLDPPRVFVALRTILAWAGLAGFLGSAALAHARAGSAGWTFLSSLFAWAIALLLSWRGYAGAYVVYREDPYRVGAPVRMGWQFRREAKGAAAFEHVEFTLQCVVETPRLGGLVRPDVRRVFASSVLRGDDYAAGAFDVDLVFDVPGDAPGSDLVGTPVVYWELAVEAEGPSCRYEDVFLVPILAAERAPEAAR